MMVELLFFEGCPHAAPARVLLQRCLDEMNRAAVIIEREGEFASPTILVDGEDVMGRPAMQPRCCRIDVPTEECILTAIRAHLGRRR